jgi:class 3 adenylate cyclase
VERRLAAILAADAVGYSRMMRDDEPGTLALLQKHRSEVIDPGIAKHHGRIVKLIGDGLLAEFSSVVEAVDCAAEIQRAMAARNGGLQSQRKMAYRIGVHLGDVIVEGDDLYGDGVNVASRLEGIAGSGGICISRQVYDQVLRKLTLGYRSLGPQTLKNIPDPVEAFTIQGDGMAITDQHQEIRYCRTADGVRLAYAISGRGPPLVKPGNWLNHLEYDWESPFLRHFFVGLSRHYRLIRHDPRGTGLSDWEVRTYRSKPGLAMSQQWLMQSAWRDSRYWVIHKAVRWRSLTRYSIRNASRTWCSWAVLLWEQTSARRSKPRGKRRLQR